MGIKFNDRFENHMDGIDPGTRGDAKKLDDAEDDAYDDDFDKKLSDVAEEGVGNNAKIYDKYDDSKKSPEDNYGSHTSHTKKIVLDGIIDAKGGERLSPATEEIKEKKALSDRPSANTYSYTMNTPKTIEHMREQMDDEEVSYFDSQIAAGGGTDGQRAHLRGTGREYYMTSSSEKKASGNFLTEDSPGGTPMERKENLQLPPENDASVVDNVVSQKPAIVLTSKVVPQEQWAKQGGYEALGGMKQVFTPNHNKDGAIDAGIYKIQRSENNIESIREDDPYEYNSKQK